MNRDIQKIAIMVVAVLVAFGIGIALFLQGESDIALWFVIIGVLAIFVIASVWYIRSVKARRLEDPAARVKERELRSVCKNFIRLRDRIHAVEEAHSITIPESISEVDAIEGALQEVGGTIDPENQSIDCDQETIKGVTLFAVRNTAQDLDQAEERFVGRLHDAAIKRADDTCAKFETLSDAGYDMDSYRVELASLVPPEMGFDEIVQYLDQLKVLTEDALRGCVDDAKKLAEYHTGDTSAARVEGALQEQDYGKAVATLEEDIATLKTATEEDFRTYRSSLLSALDVAIGATHDERFAEFKTTVLDASSSEKLVQIREVGDAFVKHCQGIVDLMHSELVGTEKHIKEFMPPDYFWKESGLSEKEYRLVGAGVDVDVDVGDLGAVEDVAGSFASAVSELVPAMNINNNAYKILNSYHRTVERQIRKQLVAHNVVSESDLKVAHPGEFLHLYDYYHPDASYHEDKGTLHLLEGAKTIENPLAIAVSDADGGLVEGAKVTLTHESGIGVTMNYVTGEDGCATIENPGDGRYRLIVDAAQYRRHEDTVVLPAHEIAITLERLGLKDYLCREKAQSIKDNLKRYASDVLRELARSGVVSSGYEMRITREYRACLLYILAEEYPNLRFVSPDSPDSPDSSAPSAPSDSEYLVYDEGMMVSRLIEIAGAMEGAAHAISDFGIPLPEREVRNLIKVAGEKGVKIAVE
ncbi:MAG TPA: hypothetical protein ENF24_05625 [Methanosarcinales archaeon]|nr:hypothetical protein [Methanosarcinales archaeon]